MELKKMNVITNDEKKNYAAYILNIIEKLPAGTLFLTEEITNQLVDEFNLDKSRARKIVNTNLNRLRGVCIDHFRKGAYYKHKTTIFGETPVNPSQYVTKTYIKRNNEIVGYETGASLLQKMGLTTQLPKYQYIATNRQKGKKIDEKLKVVLQKPTMEVKEDNYLYLQVLDAIENKDHIIMDSMNPNVILNHFIEENHLDFGKLVAIADAKYPKAVTNKIIKLAQETRL